MPSARLRFSGDAARPTMARITPKPVPAMPKPTRISRNWCWPGVTAKLESTRPSGIKDCAGDDGPPVAKPFGNGAENRLADAPSEVLDGDGHGKISAQPAEFGGDGELEHAKAGADAEVQHQDQGPGDQDGGEQGGFGQFAGSVPWEADAGRSGGNGQIKSGDGGYAFWERVRSCDAFGLQMAQPA